METYKAIIFLFFLIPFSFSAIIKGVVYLPDLSEANNSILIINTTPEQVFVLKDASYSINVSPGNYNISVFYEYNGVVLHGNEELLVVDNGTYNIDIILLTPIDDEGLDLYELDFDLFKYNDTKKDTINILSDLLIIILALLIIYYLIKSKKKDISYEELPSDLKLIIELLNSKNGRATQRELREELKWSEAKLSLALAELEHLGFVKKIKKGRGNIVIMTSVSRSILNSKIKENK